MLKVLVKILAVASLFAIIIIAKEFLEIYVVLKSIWIGFAYVFIALVCFVIIYFAIMPFWKIYRLSQIFNPETDIKRVDEEYKKRITILRKNKYLIEVGHHIPDNSNYKENYDAAIQKLENKSKEIREKYICNVFYSTALAQNGFLDAVLILSAGINLIQETFYLFNGRASNRDMWKVIRQIYFSIAIGGTEVTEFTVDELIKIGPKTMESVPFAGKIMKSIADGYVNAVLLTRVALITENYCKIVYIKTDRDLYPAPTYIASVAKDITQNIREKMSDFISNNIKRMKDKTMVNSRDAIRWIYKNSIGELINIKDNAKGNNFAKYLKVVTAVVAPGVYIANKVGVKILKKGYLIGD